ncbi:hypothetical protein [Caldivirga sp. UBA161]|uniref:hypothetical protein n=1 Tax=Caldivirga sp. UBA161 TaxID=1915569 RepID=UPI0025C29220|nr:hypothetical protein [Caldivirga sp. UBA161]
MHQYPVALIHGSRDPEYINDVDSFFKRIGIGYIFLLGRDEGIIPGSFPLFLNWGKDYENALRFTDHRLNPLLGIGGFINELKMHIPKTIIMHGSSDIEALRGIGVLKDAGFEVRLLNGEPSVYTMDCSSEAYLLFLFKGIIVRKATEVIKAKCPLIKLSGPLSLEPWFPDLILRILKSHGILD